jgi:hypothetical protein
LPAGILLILGGVFSILPGLGIWMLPLGLLLVALDVPFLRKPIGQSAIWATDKWAALKPRLMRLWRREAPGDRSN